MNIHQDSLWEKIAGKLHGELNDQENVEFNELMAENRHLTEFEKAQKIKLDLSKAGIVPDGGRLDSWNTIDKRIRFYQLRWFRAAFKYAAIILFAFLSGNYFHSAPAPDQTLRFSEIKVPSGQMSQLTLSDGTKVWLNSGTTLRFPEHFGDKSRTVTVRGEAFFKVAKNPDKPFIVNSTNLKVEVLGTSFNFSAYKEDAYTSVTLVEGKVAVQDSLGKQIAQLGPGQMATKDKGSGRLDIKEVKTSSYAAWTEGKIVFDDESLDQIACKLERWFNVEISFADEKLKSKRFTGTILKNKPVDQIMQALELLSPISFRHQINANGKDKIIIYKRT